MRSCITLIAKYRTVSIETQCDSGSRSGHNWYELIPVCAWKDKRRSASKVTDFRRYHLSGDLDQVIKGKVSGAVELLETTMSQLKLKEDATTEEMEELLKENRDNGAKLQQQVQAMKIRNALEVEKMQNEQWEYAIEQLKQSRELMKKQHEDNMEQLRRMTEESTAPKMDQAVAWMRTQLDRNPKGGPYH